VILKNPNKIVNNLSGQARPGRVTMMSVPAEDPWQTALHVAAMEGRLDLARTLLRLGADPGLRDQRFGSTPLGWARYFGQEQLIGLLEPVTAADEPAAGHGSAP
jgi:hypothetical protein